MKANWISVKDQLPEFDKRILMYMDVREEWKSNNYGIIIGYLNQTTMTSSGTYYEFLDEETRSPKDITHWQPLEPPIL